MAQNIYDQPEFFEAYSALRRSTHGLDGAAEWPAVRALLPHMPGLNVIDLGCGFGWFCRWAREHGAARVTGLDLSERMLARARAATRDEAIDYEQADLEWLQSPVGAFDLAYSSLAFHYVENAERLFAEISRSLKPGGLLVFSAEHPIYSAPAKPRWGTDENGARIWPLNHYFHQGPRTTDWLSKGVVKYHRTLGATLTLLIRSGFAIEHVEEFCPTPEQVTARPDLAEELDRPMFMIVRARAR